MKKKQSSWFTKDVAFVAGEVYSLSGVKTPDHEEWLKEVHRALYSTRG
jgi:hypothetical protein